MNYIYILRDIKTNKIVMSPSSKREFYKTEYGIKNAYECYKRNYSSSKYMATHPDDIRIIKLLVANEIDITDDLLK